MALSLVCTPWRWQCRVGAKWL